MIIYWLLTITADSGRCSKSQTQKLHNNRQDENPFRKTWGARGG